MLARSEALCRNPAVNPRLRASLAAQYLLAAETYDESRRQAAERLAKMTLFDVSNIEAAGMLLILIARHAAASKRGWSDWVTEWAIKYPQSPFIGAALQYLLGATAVRKEIVEAALVWLCDTPSTTAHSEVWKQLIAATDGRDDIVAAALTWLRDTPSTAAHAEVWRQLIAATEGRKEIVEAGEL